MWNRKELKQRAKGAVKRNYWKSVLVSALFASAFAAGGSGGKITTETVSGSLDNALNNPIILLGAVALVLVVAALAVLICAVIMGPFEVGVCRFRLRAVQETGNVSDLGSGFDVSFKRNAATLLCRDVYLVLWTLLLIIPGLIKCYEYRMIPYLLADNPEMTRKEAFRTSKAMMKGNKWRAFALDLSFLLWILLGAVTFGIVTVLYVDPYMQLTEAALYEKLKANQ